jgi:hypothetical protein
MTKTPLPQALTGVRQIMFDTAPLGKQGGGEFKRQFTDEVAASNGFRWELRGQACVNIAQGDVAHNVPIIVQHGG